MVRRVLAAVVVVSVVASGLFLLSSPPAVGLSLKQWATDADFAGGSFFNTQVVGTGNPASIQLIVSPTYGWNHMFPVNPPSPRQGVSMAYDPVNHRILAFGGELADNSMTNELWAYNVTRDEWTRVIDSNTPTARWKAGFSYDPGERVVIMYGGQDLSGWRNDLWRLFVSNDTWQQLSPAGQTPRGLESTPLVYDSRAGVHILAATNSITSTFETWQYSAVANAWTNRNPSGQIPPTTSGHSLTYDAANDKVILFGGGSGLTLYGDVYEYDYTSNSWVDARPWQLNATPNKRTDHTFTFGPHNAEDLLFGGIDNSSSYQPGTWIYVSQSRTWFQATTAVSPLARKNHAMAWDSSMDRLVMFGGTLTTGPMTNETWIWGPGYASPGTYSSPTFDAGCPSPLWQVLSWNATVPSMTAIRLRLATSSSPSGPFSFVGPDGLPGSSYNDSAGQQIWSGHNRPPNQRYLQWFTRLTSGTGSTTPSLDDVTVTYGCSDQLPYIVSTTPADHSFGFPVLGSIVATFNMPMDTSSVNWTFTEPIDFTPSWDPTDTILTLSHTTPFTKCKQETMQISGRDQANNLSVVEGTVPNPWTFSVDCSAPKITHTTPADGDFSVPLDASLVVTFSTPMDTTTARWNITPAVTLTSSWDGTESVLTLGHTTPFATCTVYTAQITAARDKAGLSIVGGPVPNPWSFTTACPNPYIAHTSPANGTVTVSPTALIVVTFSKSMDTTNVTVSAVPALSITFMNWSANDTVLSVDHVRLAELTHYTVTVTGSDTGGLPLIAGPAPNPWSFWTAMVPPKILQTVPAAGATNVPLGAPILVTFSETMDTATVTVTIVPSIPLTRTWNPPSNTFLNLTHTTQFAPCTTYTVTIGGDDMQGNQLASGPVPNPWSFTTACPLLGPGHLRVSMAGADVQLTWDSVAGATQYRIYGAGDRFTAWPWTQRGTVTGTSFLATGDGADGLTHYYIVRAYDGTKEGANSSMGVKTMLRFPQASVNTNAAWFSLPYSTTYLRASDIANALGPANINVVGKWIPSQQRAVVYYFARGRWQGTDFPIAGGDGLYLGVVRAFSWNVTGTDANLNLPFTLNPPPAGNVNWISVPWTGTYRRASDLATALGPAKVTQIGLWNATTQTSVTYTWTGSAWTGTDFAIAPGAGVYLLIASTFMWAPSLITPAVP